MGDKYHVGDFDGDGKSDILCVSKSPISDNNQLEVALSTGTDFGFPRVWDQVFGMPGDRIYTGDFDRDGLTDVAIAREYDSSKGGYQSSTIDWYVETSNGGTLRNGGSFSGMTKWYSGFGNAGDIFF